MGFSCSWWFHRPVLPIIQTPRCEGGGRSYGLDTCFPTRGSSQKHRQVHRLSRENPITYGELRIKPTPTKVKGQEKPKRLLSKANAMTKSMVLSNGPGEWVESCRMDRILLNGESISKGLVRRKLVKRGRPHLIKEKAHLRQDKNENN
jgi:hypothetical protein